MAIYDVYLQNRLTEMDVIISQLAQKDSLSSYNVMYLLCAMEELGLYKQLAGQTSVEIDAKLFNIIKTVHELMESKIYIDAQTDLYSKVFNSGNVNLELDVSKADLIKKYFTGGNSVLEIFTEPLPFYIAYSLGTVDFDTLLKTNLSALFKEDYESFRTEFRLLMDIGFSGAKIAELKKIALEFSTNQASLFYQTVIIGQTMLYLSTSPMGDYILDKVLHGLDSNMILSTSNNVVSCLNKFATAESYLDMLIKMTEILVQFFISGHFVMALTCEARISQKKYRKVSEMDNYALSAFDNMSLSEVDLTVID